MECSDVLIEGPDRFEGPKAPTSQILQTTNRLIARSLSGSTSCAW